MDKEEVGSSKSIEGFKGWRPHERQEDFLSIPYDVFEALYGGALGGGKTDALIMGPVVLRTNNSKKQLYEHPQFTGIIFRRTFPQLEKKVIPRAKEVYEALGAKYNETKKVFTFPSGAKIFLGHMEKESDVAKYDTDEYQYVGIDQAEQFTEYQLRYISSRIRSPHPDLPKIYRMAANPGGESHIYLRDRFVKPCPNGNMILLDKLTGLKRIYIPARLTDNPSLMEGDPDYINRLQLLPEKEREAKMNGDWFSFAGAVFSELRLGWNIGEPSNANHLVKPFTIPQYWPKVLAIDWGFAANTCAGWGALSPEGILYIYRIYKTKRTSVKEWSADLARESQFDGNLVKVVLDPSAYKDEGHEKRIVDLFVESSGFHFVQKADNDRRTGVELIHEYLRWNPKPQSRIERKDYDHELANRILRINGLEAHKQYCDQFIPEKLEENLPKVRFFEGYCEDLTSALQSCQYDEHKPEDYAEFDGDDPVDMFRYLLKAARLYLDSARAEGLYLQKQDDIVRKLQETGDMTGYYMQMAALEKKKGGSIIKPVRRYH